MQCGRKTSFDGKIYQNLLLTCRIKTIQVLLKHRQINHMIKNRAQMAMDYEKEEPTKLRAKAGLFNKNCPLN